MKDLIKFHDGETIELEFNEEKHWYFVDGEYIPSVTTVLNSIAKPALLPWAVKEGADWFKANCLNYESFHDNDKAIDAVVKGIKGAYRKKSEGAMNIGDILHKWCEGAILWKLGKGPIPEMPDNPKVKESIDNFREWVSSNEVEWLSAEEKLYNRKYGFAGTVDAVAEVNGEFAVIDFKTSKRIYNEYQLQVAAYAETVEDIYGRDVDCCWLLRFDKFDGSFEDVRISGDEHADNFTAFHGAKMLYSRLNTLKNRAKSR